MKAGLLRQDEIDDITASHELITMKRMLGKQVARWLYCIGALLLSLGSISVTIWGITQELWWVAILAIVLGISGNLAWRLLLEWWLLLYSINDKLSSITKALRPPSG